MIRHVTGNSGFCWILSAVVVADEKSGGLHQYNPQKPNKWGYKFFLLCGKSGIVHKLEMYLGKASQTGADSELGKSGAVVARMMQNMPKNINHKVIFDNWFASPKLALKLAADGFFCLGTLRLSRAPGLLLASDKTLKGERKWLIRLKTSSRQRCWPSSDKVVRQQERRFAQYFCGR